jgi:hypothetical protein
MNSKRIKTIALLCLPSIVFVILANRRSEDKRPIKYFLPYWKVRSHILSFHRIEHVRKVYGTELEQPLMKGFKGFIRSWLPFGLVLWLDKGAPVSTTALSSGVVAGSPTTGVKTVGSPDVANLDKKLDALRQEVSLRQDRLEVLLLRALRQK